MGRFPHQRGSFFETPEDRKAAEKALDLTGCRHLEDRNYGDLSGGEQQLIGLASSLAQEPDVLLLDEPTVFLDLKHQLRILRILKRLNQKEGMTQVIVTHDLNLAQSFCTRLVFLKELHDAGFQLAQIEVEMLGLLEDRGGTVIL